MRLTTRLRDLENKRLSEDAVPALRIVLVDAEGRWWERGQEVAPEAVDPRTRVVLLRTRATDIPRCA